MLYIDFETYSELALKKAGTYRYAQNCEITLMGYAFDNAPAKVWDSTELSTPPGDVVQYLNQGGEITAHNAMFDRNILAYSDVLPTPALNRFRCTMVKAYTVGLPPALGQLGQLLGLPEDEQKMQQGKKLINRFCKPAPKNHKVDRYTRHNDPDNWEMFVEYCRQDVETMRRIDKRLPSWTYPNSAELELWQLDQEINDRGMYVDVDFIHRAIELVTEETQRLNAELNDLTHGQVQKGTCLTALAKWVNAHGVKTDSLNKAVIVELLKQDIPSKVRRALTIRQQVGKSSTAKYQTLLGVVNKDNRLRGALQFYGAARTGRWAGRMFQPQNLPRPSVNQQAASSAIENDMVGLLYDDAMEVASSCIRSAISAPPGKKLIVSDLANIEGRMLAWLAGEKWKLNAFTAYDTKTGPDMYRLAYSKSFGLPVHLVTDKQRQVGKVEELALGYGGGVGAFVSMAKGYNVNIEDGYESIMDAAPGYALEKAEWAWLLAVYKKQTMDLSKRAFIAADIVKTVWRAAHPHVVQFWYAIEAASHAAVRNPGRVYRINKIQISVRESILLIKLPSKRLLCYQQPRLIKSSCNDFKPELVYSGSHPVTKKWGRIDTWGGKLVENITQAAARDVLAHGMRNVAKFSRMNIVLTVHDEVVCEVEEHTPLSVEDVNQCLIDGPDWADGLPLAANGYEDRRYRK